MSDVTELLSKVGDNKDSYDKNVIKKLGELDLQYPNVMAKLEEIQNQGGKGEKKEAQKAFKKLSSKPVAEATSTEVDRGESTAFDDEVGDSSLKAGEYDVEDSLSKSEEDRLEAEAAGKGLKVKLIETNRVQLDYFGNLIERGESTGKIIVKNTGSESRISGVDLLLKNVDKIKADEAIEEATNIGILAPGPDNKYKKEYQFESEYETIKVTQDYIDPETDLSPDFVGGKDAKFECRIKIENTSSEDLTNVTGVKTINSVAEIEEMQFEGGDITHEGDAINFNIEKIEAGASVDILIKMTGALEEGVDSYESGELVINYDNDALTSGLEFESVDGVSDVKQVIRRKQREEEPGFYDCEVRFKNLSEFVYDLNKFTVYADSMENDVIVLDWDGTNANEDEREIVPTEEKVFEFTFESIEGAPTFGNVINFSVQHEIVTRTITEITLPAQDLKFMAIAIDKAFLIDGEEVTEYELPSYVETPVETVVTVTGVGTYPLEGMKIYDQIPEGFSEPILEEIKVFRDGDELVTDAYFTEIGADPEGIRALVVDFEHLEDSAAGAFKENDVLKVQYTTIAQKPSQQDDPIYAKSIAEAFVYEAPESIVRKESELEGVKFVVVHLRAQIDIGKSTRSTLYEGIDGYRIELEAINSGTAMAKIHLQDLIPEGFEFVADSISLQPEGETLDTISVSDGTVHGWEFSNVAPSDEVVVSFMVTVEDSSADPRKLQSVYKG